MKNFKLIFITLFFSINFLYSSDKNNLDKFYDPFYYEDLDNLLDLSKTSIIDKYNSNKIENNGKLSNKDILEEIDKKMNNEMFNITKVKKENKNFVESKENIEEKRETFLENIDNKLDKLPKDIDDEITGEKKKSTIEIIKRDGSVKIETIENTNLKRK